MVELAALCIIIVVGIPLALFAAWLAAMMVYGLAKLGYYMVLAIAMVPWIICVWLFVNGKKVVQFVRRKRAH